MILKFWSVLALVSREELGTLGSERWDSSIHWEDPGENVEQGSISLSWSLRIFLTFSLSFTLRFNVTSKISVQPGLLFHPYSHYLNTGVIISLSGSLLHRHPGWSTYLFLSWGVEIFSNIQIWPYIQLCLKTHTCWHAHTHILKFFSSPLTLIKHRASIAVFLHLFLYPDTPKGSGMWMAYQWLRGKGREEGSGRTPVTCVCKNPWCNFDMLPNGEVGRGHTSPPTCFQNIGSKAPEGERPPRPHPQLSPPKPWITPDKASFRNTFLSTMEQMKDSLTLTRPFVSWPQFTSQASHSLSPLQLCKEGGVSLP